MKRFILLLGVIMLFTGVKLRDRGLLRVAEEGVFYTQTESGFEETEIPVFNNGSGYQRFDVKGVSAKKAIATLRARTVFVQETVEGLTIYYCFSPLLKSSVTLKGKTVNLMIADGGDGLVLGSPLIKGSY